MKIFSFFPVFSYRGVAILVPMKTELEFRSKLTKYLVSNDRRYMIMLGNLAQQRTAVLTK